MRSDNRDLSSRRLVNPNPEMRGGDRAILMSTAGERADTVGRLSMHVWDMDHHIPLYMSS